MKIMRIVALILCLLPFISWCEIQPQKTLYVIEPHFKLFTNVNDNSLWSLLYRGLAEHGFEVKQAKSISQVHDYTYAIFNNAQDMDHVRGNPQKYPPHKLMLLTWEPPSVIAANHNPQVLKLFGKVLTWRDDLIDNKKYFKFYIPYSAFKAPSDTLSYNDKKLCTMVASHLRSRHPHELYSERKKVVDFFENIQENVFDFYGARGWRGKYKNYKGKTNNKKAVMKQYRFCICYENINNIQGYVSEKIFDALTSGSVPVYWGATNITDYVPEECFVDRRKFKNTAELYEFMKNMGAQEYQQYIDAIKAFLGNSSNAHVYSFEHFAHSVIEALLHNDF